MEEVHEKIFIAAITNCKMRSRESWSYRAFVQPEWRCTCKRLVWDSRNFRRQRIALNDKPINLIYPI